MKLKYIFVDENTYEGLHSVSLKGKDVLERVFGQWEDVSYVRNYCTNNLSHLQNGYYGDIDLEQAIKEIVEEVAVLREKIISTNRWEELFQALNDNQTGYSDLSKVKVKLKRQGKPIRKLRLYGIRISKNTFIVTGGSIKVTHQMDGHDDTIKENDKIESLRNWLIEKEIYTEENLKEYYDEQNN